MSAFAFTDLVNGDPARCVVARVSIYSRELGGRDLPGGAVFRPNHNFGDESNRAFYIGQVEIPFDGLRAGESRIVKVTFLSGKGLNELLCVGRTWRLQSGGNCIGTAEVLEVQ
jgi:hypothetical protein